MSVTIRVVDYYNVTVTDEPWRSVRNPLTSKHKPKSIYWRSVLVPRVGPEHTHLVLFPENSQQLTRAANMRGMKLWGPSRAILIQGDDRLGTLAEVHHTLAAAQVNVFASNGVTDGQGGFGYILYVRGEDCERAARALGI